MYEKGIITGRSENIFAPEKKVSRAEIAVILDRFSKENASKPTVNLNQDNSLVIIDNLTKKIENLEKELSLIKTENTQLALKNQLILHSALEEKVNTELRRYLDLINENRINLREIEPGKMFEKEDYIPNLKLTDGECNKIFEPLNEKEKEKLSEELITLGCK